MNKEKQYRELSSTIISIMKDDPRIGLFLAGVNRQFVDDESDVTTAAICFRGGNICLLINSNFWSTLTEEQRNALCYHECTHLELSHLSRITRYADRYIANLAMDILINDLVPYSLPEGAITRQGFLDMGLEMEKHRELGYYYKILVSARENPSNTEISRLLEAHLDANSDLQRSHRLWGTFEGDRNADQVLEKAGIELSKGKGWDNSSFGKDSVQLTVNEKEDQIDWSTLLQLTLQQQMDFDSEQTLSKSKFSRRYGPPNPGLKLKPRPEAVVALDVSGSIGNTELEGFIGEISCIVNQTGATAQIFPFDTRVREPLDIRTGTELANLTINDVGGGTNYDCLASEELFSGQTLIIFTDGFAAEMKSSFDHSINVIWVISPNGTEPGEPCFDQLEGTVIKTRG